MAPVHKQRAILSTRRCRDRLVDDHDREWYDELMKKQLTKFFNMRMQEVFGGPRCLPHHSVMWGSNSAGRALGIFF